MHPLHPRVLVMLSALRHASAFRRAACVPTSRLQQGLVTAAAAAAAAVAVPSSSGSEPALPPLEPPWRWIGILGQARTRRCDRAFVVLSPP